MWLKRCLLVLSLAAAIGCSSGETTQRVAPPKDQSRAVLEAIAQSGIVDSGVMTVKEELEKLKATDPAKADALLNDLADLQKPGSPDRIKAKAKEMLAKLPDSAAK